MERVTIDEKGIGEALQRYLEDRGYTVHHLQMKFDSRTQEFSAVADVQKD